MIPVLKILLYKPVFLVLLALLALLLVIPPASLAAGSSDPVPDQETRQIPAKSFPADLNLTPEERDFLKTHPVIRVGNEDDWPPFDFSIHGRPTGYAIDHLELLGRRLGISFEYVNGYSWFELLNLFREKKIDLLPSLWISEDRKEFMSFTQPYLTLPYVIVAGKDDRSIQGFEDLKGKTVAVAKGYKQEAVLGSDYPQINTYVVQNALEGMEAVIYDMADAYIGYQGTVAYLMASHFLADLRICGEVKAPELGPQGLYIAVRQDLPLLRSVLQKAMDTVTHKEKVELAQKWITVERTKVPELTSEEKIFLRQNPALRVDNLKDWPPFNFRKNGKHKGFCIDYMDLLAHKLGIEVEYVSGPTWGGFMEMLQTGDIDCLCDVVKTKNREETIAFTDPYFVIFSGIVVKKGGQTYNKVQDLAGKKVAVPEGFYYQEILERHYPDIEVVTKENTLNCLKAVSSGQVEAALAEKPVFDYLITQHFLTDLTSTSLINSRHFENTPVSIGVHKDRTMLRDILQKAMDAVTEDERSAIYRRWLNTDPPKDNTSQIIFTPHERQWLEGRTDLTMCAHPSRPPFEQLGPNGDYAGIVAEIIGLLEERIGVPITVIPTKSWSQSLEYLRTGKCDLISSVVKGPKEEPGLAVSPPYLESAVVMVVRSDQPYLPDLHALEGKRVGIVKDNPVARYIQTHFPKIDIHYYPDLDEALKNTAKGEIDVALGSLHRVSYTIHDLGLYDLKIAGQTPYKDYLGLGINSQSPELKSIINKAVETLSAQEVSKITRKWLSIRYDKGFDTFLLLQILAGGGFLLAVFVLWNRKLARLNREIAEAHKSLALKSQELETLSITDRLTGLYNRMKLEEVLANELKRAHRTGQSFSIILLDIDLFKDINDTFGHQVGDEVLRELAELLLANIRQTDTVGRWGGEEFMIVCPETDREGGVILAENLRQKISTGTMAQAGHVTCSFGVAGYSAGEGENLLIARVDKALHKAKNKGRNRVESAETILSNFTADRWDET